jgi:hypothetical protein
MTWQEFIDAMEHEGVQPDDRIKYIDTTGVEDATRLLMVETEDGWTVD